MPYAVGSGPSIGRLFEVHSPVRFPSTFIVTESLPLGVAFRTTEKLVPTPCLPRGDRIDPFDVMMFPTMHRTFITLFAGLGLKPFRA